ncbi:MAG: hypothetical protein Q8N83_09200 [Ignavibacteria bacterium]|nr:hypothetical protein [Ignavibacteria bacterium]
MKKINYLKSTNVLLIVLTGILFHFSCSDKLPDLTAPAIINPPSHLKATFISGSKILLTWIDNSQSEDGFIIEKKINNYYERAAVLEANSESFIDTTSLQNLKSVIYYRVYAFKENVNSEPVMLSYQERGLNAPSNLLFEQSSSNSVKLIWQDNSDVETAFVVEKIDFTGTYIKIADLPPNTTSYTVTDLDTNSVHHFRITAMLNSSNSGYTNTIMIKYGLDVTKVQNVENTYGVKTAYFIPNTEFIALVFNFDNTVSASSPLKIIKRDGTIVREINDKNPCVAVSSSGSIIATSGINSDINIWDVQTGTLLQVIKRRSVQHVVEKIAISPDNKLLAVNQHVYGRSSGSVDMYNITDGTLRWTKDIVFMGSILHFTVDGSELFYTDFSGSYIQINKANSFTGSFINTICSYQFISWASFSQSGRFMLLALGSSMSTHDYYLIDLSGIRPVEGISSMYSNENIGSADIIESDGSDPYLNYSSYSGSEYANIYLNETNIKWRINLKYDKTPVFNSAFQNIKLYPDGKSALGFGYNTNVKILELGKKWNKL